MTCYYHEIDEDDVRLEVKTRFRTFKILRLESCVYSVVQETPSGWLELQVLDGLREAREYLFTQL